MLDKVLLATSIWISPIATTAHYSAPLSIAVPIGFDTWAAPDIWSIPLYTAQSTDNVEPVLFNPNAWYMVALGTWKRSGNSAAIESEILNTSANGFPYPGNVYSTTSPYTWTLPSKYKQTVNPASGAAEFYVPSGAAPAAGPDGHMAVTQPNGTVLETYATIVLSTGQVVALSYSVSDLRSNGNGYENGQTASMLPCYLGVIDDTELNRGEIGHAMAITVPPSMLAAAVSYPAYAFDRNAITQNPPYSGKLPMGAHLAIPASFNITSLNLTTPEGVAIATAAKTYGFIIVDRGGTGISLRIRHNSPTPDQPAHTWNWSVQSDLNKIFAHLAKVE